LWSEFYVLWLQVPVFYSWVESFQQNSGLLFLFLFFFSFFGVVISAKFTLFLGKKICQFFDLTKLGGKKKSLLATILIKNLKIEEI